jgi:YhgE/Pip-like protein
MSTPPPPTEMRVRASEILRIRRIWLIPVALATVFVALMTAIYIGSVVNPAKYLHGLPVMVVNQDTGATAGGKRVDAGAELVHALEGSSAVSSRLKLTNATLAQATANMDRAGAYATLVIPPHFTTSVLLPTGRGKPPSDTPSPAAVDLLQNFRLGSLGVSLADAVITPAIAKISAGVGTKLGPLATPAARSNPVMAAQLANPITLKTTDYRPLPPHTGLGLSAFYVALLAMMAGFLSATLINASIDAALGYGATEVGPHWRQRRPVAINRRQTLLVKAVAAVVAAPLLTGVLLLVAVVALNMHAPNVLWLWGLAALTSVMIGFGTLALLAAFGSIGQLLAMILLIYLSLASSGGTVPVEALPGFFAFVAHVEPLRQVLLGTRAILYFDAQMDAGLRHSLIVIAAELVFWAVVGFAVVTWYDRKGLYRIAPELFSVVSEAIDDTVEKRRA